MAERTVHKNIRIRGNVQGVGFRISAQRKAQELGIKGFIRNEADESVYLEVEADPEAVETFISWCKDGPSSAVVQDIHIQDGEVKEYTTFNIRYT